MKKIFWALVLMILTLIGVASAEDVKIDSTNFLDANFIKYILANYDLNNNGFVSEDEISEIVEDDWGRSAIVIDLNNDSSIKSLNGIELLFDDIWKIEIKNCPGVTKLDLSSFYAHTVKINNVPLKELKLNKKYACNLSVSNTELTSIDLTGLGNKSSCGHGYAPDTSLYLSNNKFKSLELSGFAWWLSIDEPFLEEIKFNNFAFSDLEFIIDAPRLKTIDFTNVEYEAWMRHYAELDFSGCTSLKELNLGAKYDYVAQIYYSLSSYGDGNGSSQYYEEYFKTEKEANEYLTKEIAKIHAEYPASEYEVDIIDAYAAPLKDSIGLYLPESLEKLTFSNSFFGLAEELEKGSWYGPKNIDGTYVYSNLEDCFDYGDYFDVAYEEEKLWDMLIIGGDTSIYDSVGKEISSKLPRKPATGVTLNKTTAELATGKTLQLIAGIAPSDTTSKRIIWSSSDTSIATVDSNGLVKAIRNGKVTITAKTSNGKEAKCVVTTRFSDVVGSGVKGDSNYLYYYAPVYWAAEAGITTGYDKVYFGVGEDCTRAAVMIFLWRLAGMPSPKKDANSYFNDVSKYSTSTATNKAIAWAYEKNISKGYADGSFGVNRSITRADVLIMLYRMAGKPKVTESMKFSDCKGYKAGTDTYNAIIWGSKKGITAGYSDGTFMPKTNCLREQIITFLYRYKNS